MTSKTQMRIQSDTVPFSTALLGRLETIGIDVKRVLDNAGIARPAASVKVMQLDTQQFFAVWAAIAEISADPGIGIRIGSEAFDGQLDLVSLCALHSRDLSDAFKKLARYKRLTCPEDVRVHVDGDEATVTFHWLLTDASAPDLLVDAIFASTVKLARRASGEVVAPKRIDLARRANGLKRLAGYFRCDIRFDAPMDALVFSSTDLSVPFITRDESLVYEWLPELDAALASISKNQSFTERVDAALLHSMRGQRPSVETLAAELAISPRTLQRRLTQNGTYYQERLDGVRQRIAQRLLAKTTLDIGEIAWFLGFEELNSFTRIFNQWEGVTPHQWRRVKSVSQSDVLQAKPR